MQRSTISYEQLQNLSDVAITALANNDGIKYDSATGKFINSPFGTATALNISGQTSGDILYFNGTNWVRLAKGSDSQVLTLASGLPSWATPSSGGSSMTAQVVALSSDQALSGTSLTDITNLTLTMPNTGKKALIVATLQIDLNSCNYVIFEMIDNSTSRTGAYKNKPTGGGNDSITLAYTVVCSGQVVKIQGRVDSGSCTIGGANSYRRSTISSQEGAT